MNRDGSPPPEEVVTDPTLPIEVLQAALATEHASVWAYGLATAFVTGEASGTLAEAVAAHRARRDATERFLLDRDVQPVPAEPAYIPPEPVTDSESALRLLNTAESDSAVAWRSVIGHGFPEPDLRRTALDALTASAVRATRWRAALGASPTTVPFPGTP